MSHLSNATEELKAFSEKFDDWIVEAKKRGDVPEILKMWNATKTHYEAADEMRKKVFASIEHLSRTIIPEVMDEKDIKTITLADIGYRFTVASKISCSMVDKNAGHEWLRGNGAEALIQPTVNASTLASFAKSYVADHGKDLPPDIFKISTMRYTSATKA
jgi:hypothetical protein